MRKKRILAQGVLEAKYHVVARANLGEEILKDEAFKQMFMDIVKEAQEKKGYKFTVLNYCIMDNHIHLVLRVPSDSSLSKILQWVLSVFAIRFNRIHKLRGHVWYDRFKSKLIDASSYVRNVFLYIMNNPVKAGLVKKPQDFRFSGVTDMLKQDYRYIEKPGQWLMELVLRAIG